MLFLFITLFQIHNHSLYYELLLLLFFWRAKSITFSMQLVGEVQNFLHGDEEDRQTLGETIKYILNHKNK